MRRGSRRGRRLDGLDDPAQPTDALRRDGDRPAAGRAVREPSSPRGQAAKSRQRCPSASRHDERDVGLVATFLVTGIRLAEALALTTQSIEEAAQWAWDRHRWALAAAQSSRFVTADAAAPDKHGTPTLWRSRPLLAPPRRPLPLPREVAPECDPEANACTHSRAPDPRAASKAVHSQAAPFTKWTRPLTYANLAACQPPDLMSRTSSL